MILVFKFLEFCPSRSLPVVTGSRCFLILPSEIPWVSVVVVCLCLGLLCAFGLALPRFFGFGFAFPLAVAFDGFGWFFICLYRYVCISICMYL